MRRFMHSRWWLLFALAWGCEQKPEPTANTAKVALSAGVVARVSGEGVPPLLVSGESVIAIAKAQHLSREDARDVAVSDALFAAEAMRQKKDQEHTLDLDKVVARRLAEEFLAQAKAQGPVTDDEIEVVTKKHWYEVARPEALLTGTAVVEIPETADEATEKRAQAVATALREAVLAIPPDVKATPSTPIPTSMRIPDDQLMAAFRKAATSVKDDGFKVTVQVVYPVGKDNLAVLPVPSNERQPTEAPYVTAAAELQHRGDVSPIFRTRYGFHVVIMLARYPGAELSLQERRARLAGEVYDGRARKLYEDLVLRLHKDVDVEVERNADALLAQVRTKDLVMEVAQAKGSSEPNVGPGNQAPSPP